MPDQQLIDYYAWYVKWYIKKYYYSADADFITIKKGVFAPREIHVQYKKIQDIYVDQDILDRIMGIYDVHIASATIASGMEAHIDGVDESTTEGLKIFLLNAIKSGFHIDSGAPKQESKIGENKPQPVNFSEEISSDKYPLTGKWIVSRIIPTFLRSFGVAMVLVVLVAENSGLDTFFANSFVSLFTILLIFLILILPLFQSIISLMLWKSKYKFNFTPEFIFYRTGVLSIQEKHIPYNTIQDVNVNQGIFDRIFGIAKVKIENASGGQLAVDPIGGAFKMGGGGVSIEGLSPADANKITDILKKIVLTKNPEATGL